MPKLHLHPYRATDEVRETVDRLHDPTSAIVHPQRIIEGVRQERSQVSRANGWVADHIVGVAGTMAFFYLLCAVLGGWTFWQSAIAGNKGFDPFPYAFLFFVLGGIMQSLFVPTMLVSANRATERDSIKDEADHRAWSHLYDVNDEQLTILRDLADRFLKDQQQPPPIPSN